MPKKRPWKRVSDKWLREHFPTTPGMPLPDYVMVNMFVDRVLAEARAMAVRSELRARQQFPDHPARDGWEYYATAWGFMHGQLSAMAQAVPGVIQWMHENTPPHPMCAPSDFEPPAAEGVTEPEGSASS